MTFVVAIVLAAGFGAGDQYLGTLSGDPWATDVSLLSAPWLVLAFLAGYTQRKPRRAALLGLICTLAALADYGLMTLSPLEHAQLTVQSLRGFTISEDRVVLAGLLTGPLFGWLGNRWRTRRAWASAVLLASALCLEPLAHKLARSAIPIAAVADVEIAIGAAMIAYVAATTAKRHSPARCD